MAVKFPLKMSDGTPVRTIEELREHFDLGAVLGYYSNGRLIQWLEDRYYNEEAGKVRDLKASSKKFNQKLCEILGVTYLEKADEKLDIKAIKSKNEHYELLKKYTTDDKILSMADDIIFMQKELDNLAYKEDSLEEDDKGNKVAYLCGEHFIIPRYMGNITYKGINNPKVEFAKPYDLKDLIESGINFQNVNFSFDDYMAKNIKIDDFGMDGTLFCSELENNPHLAINPIRISAEKGSIDAWVALGWCYSKGFGVDEDKKEALKWYQKAAEQGNKFAKLEVENLKLWINHEKKLQGEN